MGITVLNDPTNSSVFPDWELPASIDITYSKGGGNNFTKLFSMRIKDYTATETAGTLKVIVTMPNISPSTTELSGGLVFGTDTVFTFGTFYNLQLKFFSINLLLAGAYSTTITLTVKRISDDSVVETKTIPVNVTIIDSGEIVNNLDPNLNFCLDDDLYFKVTTNVSKFIRVNSKITYKNKVTNLEHLYAVLDGEVSIPIGVPVQPYIYLSETEIDSFFTNYKLDMVPADVELDVYFLSQDYVEEKHYQLGIFKFHAGRSKNIPEDDSLIERSLSYNSYLPLAYRYPTQNIEFIFMDKTVVFNKQQFSSPLNIFQIFFIQKYHSHQPQAAFSGGFSGGFATLEALLKADPFYLYKEGYFNYINSSYNVKGINFPWQKNSKNIVWLDENNIFRGMAFTGAFEKEPKYKHFINENSVDFKNKKAGSTKDKVLKINSGYKLKSEIPIFNSLLKSKRAWIFGNTPEDRKEIVCTTEKYTEDSSAMEVIDFTLEFYINE